MRQVRNWLLKNAARAVWPAGLKERNRSRVRDGAEAFPGNNKKTAFRQDRKIFAEGRGEWLTADRIRTGPGMVKDRSGEMKYRLKFDNSNAGTAKLHVFVMETFDSGYGFQVVLYHLAQGAGTSTVQNTYD